MEQKVEMAVVPNKVENENKDFKVVSDPSIARKLLKDGFTIADIKSKKSYPRESVFVFKVEDGFMDKLNGYLESRTKK